MTELAEEQEGFHHSSSKNRETSANHIVCCEHVGVLSMTEWIFVNEGLLDVKETIN